MLLCVSLGPYISVLVRAVWLSTDSTKIAIRARKLSPLPRQGPDKLLLPVTEAKVQGQRCWLKGDRRAGRIWSPTGKQFEPSARSFSPFLSFEIY